MISGVLEGIVVNPGKYRGRAYVAGPDNKRPFQKGDVLVVPQSHPQYSLLLMHAGALVCESGAIMAHICIIAGELGVPCITQVAGATSMIRDNSWVEVDADKGQVTILE